MLKENEKFIAFCLLGAGLIALAIMAYAVPMRAGSDSSSIQIINTIVGALTLAFGGAANALFRISDSVKVSNTDAEAVPVEPASGKGSPEKDPAASDEELPDYAR